MGGGGCGAPLDYGKHALSVIGVDIRVLDPKGRGVWGEGGSGFCGKLVDDGKHAPA